MAKQTGIYFIGRYGNVVGSTWKGIPYFKFQPGKINQSKATRESVNFMAQASPIAAAFRKSFIQLLPQPKNREMQNAFNGAVKKWLQTKPFEQKLPTSQLPFVTGYEFNKQSLLNNRLRLSITLQQVAQQELLLHIPSFIPTETIAAPAYTKQVNINIIASCYHHGKAVITNTFESAFTILITILFFLRNKYNYHLQPLSILQYLLQLHYNM